MPPAVDAAVQRALARTPADRFQTASELAAALVTADTPAPPVLLRMRRRFRWLTAAVAAGLFVIAVLAWLAMRKTATTTTDDAVASIAVLPFVNTSADASHEYFADGLTDELISSLSRVDGLQVASRTSAFAFKGRDLDVREIGRRLGGHSVIEGSVRRSDSRIRVSAQLVSVADGYQRWSEAYERDVRDALVIQEELASAIVQMLKGQLGSGDRAALRGATTDPEAYDRYLRGRFFWHQRTEEGLRRAVEHFREAVESAPDFARAYTGLADAYAVLGFYDYDPPHDVFPEAKRAATQALRLDPSLGAAHATLGYAALYYDWDWQRAEQEFQRAIALDPDYSTSHQWFANFLTAMGRFDEAEAAMRRAQELDPLSLIANAALGWVLYYKGDYERVVARYRAVLELNPTFELAHLWSGQALEMLGRTDEALAALQRAVELSGEGAIFVAALARTYAVRGERAEAERWLRQLEAGRYVPSFEIAKVYVALGPHQEALRWLERAYAERAHSMAFLRVDPQLAALRRNPSFERLALRVGW